MYGCVCACVTSTHGQALGHTSTLENTHVHIRMQRHTRACQYTRRDKQTHKQTHKQTNTKTHTDTHTHTHTHTHIRIPLPVHNDRTRLRTQRRVDVNEGIVYKADTSRNVRDVRVAINSSHSLRIDTHTHVTLCHTCRQDPEWDLFTRGCIVVPNCAFFFLMTFFILVVFSYFRAIFEENLPIFCFLSNKMFPICQ